MDEGRQVSEYQKNYVIELLQEFNRKHRLNINEAFGIDLEPVETNDFLSFVADAARRRFSTWLNYS